MCVVNNLLSWSRRDERGSVDKFDYLNSTSWSISFLQYSAKRSCQKTVIQRTGDFGITVIRIYFINHNNERLNGTSFTWENKYSSFISSALEQILITIFPNILSKSSNGPTQLVVRIRYHPSKSVSWSVSRRSCIRTQTQDCLPNPLAAIVLGIAVGT